MVEAEIVLKKARTSGAAEHGSAVVTNARVTVHPLPDTLDDVATEDVSTLAKDKTPLDDVIATLKAAGHGDPRGAEILAAAITRATPVAGIDRLPLEVWLILGE